MRFFSDLFDGIASSVRTVVHVAADVASTAATVIKHKYLAIKTKYAAIDIEFRKQGRFDELKQVNDEIIDIEAKWKRDQSLSAFDHARLNELCLRRTRLRGKIEAAKEIIAAKDIAENTEEYAYKEVEEENPNELTRLGGQVMLGKLCPACQRPQVIRWKNSVREPTISDLFWGCTGLFVKDENGSSVCRKTQPFSRHDREIFANIARPGLELPTQRLNNIVLRPETSQLIKNKLSDAVSASSENYLCPVHHEPLQLRTKSDAADLLDLYYLKCRRCDQTVKVKSATQLDALLQSYDQNGLF
jgi:hypothetical protein